MCLCGVATFEGKGCGVVAVVSLLWAPMIGPSGQGGRACVCMCRGYECSVVLILIVYIFF